MAVAGAREQREELRERGMRERVGNQLDFNTHDGCLVEPSLSEEIGGCRCAFAVNILHRTGGLRRLHEVEEKVCELWINRRAPDETANRCAAFDGRRRVSM